MENVIYTFAGIGIGLIVKDILPAFVKEYFGDKQSKKLKKTQVKDRVIELLAEAKSSDFVKQPQDIKHYYETMMQLKLIDLNLGSRLQLFLDFWELNSMIKSGPKSALEEIHLDRPHVQRAALEMSYSNLHNLYPILLKGVSKL